MSQNLTIGAEYNLSFYAPAVLGTGLRKARLTAILDYDTVRSLSDVASTHATVYAQLPAGTPRSPSKLVYYKFATTSGDAVIVSSDWISGTPEVATTTTQSVTFDNVSTGDIARLRALLVANGYSFVFNDE